MEQKYVLLQEEILSLLSCLAGVLDTSFDSHYNKFMPGLKKILVDTKWETQQDQQLRASCIECIGFILSSVKEKPEICRQDAIDVCQNIIEILVNGNLQESDPQITAIPTAISQISTCIKEEFKQFLPHLMPALIRDAQRDVDFKVRDADDFEGEEENAKDGRQTLQLKVKGMEGQKQVSMNTYALEVKINAVQILKNLARNLGVHIFEYIEDIAKVCIEKLLEDPFAQTLRKESAKVMRFCIGACKEHPEKQKALFIMTYIRLMTELEKRKPRGEFEQVNFILKMLYKMTQYFKSYKEKGMLVYQVEDATKFVDRLAGVVTAIREDRESRLKTVKALSKHMDQQDLEDLEEDIETVDKGIRHVMELSGFLLQNMGEQISGHIATTLLPLYASVLMSPADKKSYELIDAVCFICDCMEHGGPAIYGQIQGQAGEKFLQIIGMEKSKSPPDFDLVQSCVFGLGLLAQKQPVGQFKELQGTLAVIEQMLQFTGLDSLDDDQKDSFKFMKDNAISSLTKIVIFQQDGSHVNDTHTQTLLKLLPITHDVEEAADLHSLFLAQIINSNATFAKNKEEVVAVLKRIEDYSNSHSGEDEDILNDEGKALFSKVMSLM